MKEGLESLGRIRLQGFALLAVTFLAGGLAGVAGERMRAASARDREPPPRAALAPGGLPPMYERLDLTDQQTRQITAILEKSRPRTDSVMRGLRVTMDSVRSQIRAVLTPDQQARLDREMARHGPPGPFEGRGRRGPFPPDGPHPRPEVPPEGPPRR